MKFRFLIIFLLLIWCAQANKLSVCQSGECDFASIQDAIDASNNGDIIDVQSGNYSEAIYINKMILLVGHNVSVDTIYYIYWFAPIVDIRPSIMIRGLPSDPNFHLENNSINGKKVNTTVKRYNTSIRNYGAVSVIGPTLDNSTRFSGDPSYTLETQVINGPVNPGDDINISFFMPGAGNLDNCILRISVPPNLVEGKRFAWRYPVIDSQGKESYEKGEITRTTLEMNISYIFGKGPYPARANIGSFGVLNGGASDPPFNISFRIANDAPRGDHSIYISLLYKNKGQWLMEKQSIPIHVRYWYESGWLQWAVYLALALGAMASLTRLIEFLGGREFLRDVLTRLTEITGLREFLKGVKNRIKRRIFGS